MTIIKDNAFYADTWYYHQDDEPLVGNNNIVSLDYWLNNRERLKTSGKSIGLAVDGDADITSFKDDLSYFSMIAINIPVFTDGRGYSLAQLLRKQHHYEQEIRANGDILPDQALYLTRVGFNALSFLDEDLATLALKKLTDFSVFYQPA